MGLNIDPTKKKWYSWTLLVSSLKWPALIRLCDTVPRQTEFNKKKVKSRELNVKLSLFLYCTVIELNFVVLAWEYIYPHFWSTGWYICFNRIVVRIVVNGPHSKSLETRY